MAASKTGQWEPAALPASGELRPTSFADQVYGRILSDIMAGVFPSGSRLPSEKRLCESFGVSRPVVREALARLQRDGLLVSRRGSGSFVLASPPADLPDAADLAQVARYQRFQEFRMVVEGAAAALAAQRRSDEDLRRIQDAHQRLTDEIGQGVFRWESDRDLHLAVATASGNEFFAASLDGREVRLSDFMTVSLKLTSSRSSQRGQLVVAEHRAIVEAIAAKDVAAARVSMENHLLQARRRMLDRSLAP